jgi:hypothetical protein
MSARRWFGMMMSFREGLGLTKHKAPDLSHLPPASFPLYGLLVHHENGNTFVMARTASGKPFVVMQVQDELVERSDNVIGLHVEYRQGPIANNFAGSSAMFSCYTGIKVEVPEAS